MIDRNLRIVFMGTPDFAVPTLRYLLEAGYPVVGVVTAPDKPGGRGMKQMISSPVKRFAESKGLNVLQPPALKARSFVTALKELKPDLQVVVAFRMLPEIVWSMPRLGTLNLHGSLLPAYRGAAPIQWAIIRGETVTGVTTFLLQHAIDTGDILLQRHIPILPDDNASILHDRMMHVGAGLVLATVDQIAGGLARPEPQRNDKASHAPKIFHADAAIDWNRTQQEVHDFIRGMSPYPGAWTMLDDQEWKILGARPIEFANHSPEPGRLLADGQHLLVGTKNGWLDLLEVQLQGKRRMGARDFLNGYRIRNWSVT